MPNKLKYNDKWGTILYQFSLKFLPKLFYYLLIITVVNTISWLMINNIILDVLNLESVGFFATLLFSCAILYLVFAPLLLISVFRVLFLPSVKHTDKDSGNDRRSAPLGHN